jgi:hypothetical protein
VFKLSGIYGMHEKSLKLIETFSGRGGIDERVGNKICLLRGNGFSENED